MPFESAPENDTIGLLGDMAAPSQIAHYQITSKLGEGGMGAVYRATDTMLHREVAIKVLPAAFAADSARMARFEREAQVLASLNHPNIAAIYGIEQGAIVMELVDGADLAGPVPIDTAIEYACQIAAGLEAAHEKGIVHRDLKPANIKVTRGGQIKILDFGLAKASEAAPQPGNPSISPTLPLGMTEVGVILGTAAYMSPEQARGKPVDQRADIWAFGVVLYELVTGRRLFEGEDLADTLAAVVKTDPDLTVVPEPIRGILHRCLQKDPNKRLRHISSVRTAARKNLPRRRHSWRLRARTAAVLWLAAALFIAGAAGWLLYLRRAEPVKPEPVRLAPFPPAGHNSAKRQQPTLSEHHDISRRKNGGFRCERRRRCAFADLDPALGFARFTPAGGNGRRERRPDLVSGKPDAGLLRRTANCERSM